MAWISIIILATASSLFLRMTVRRARRAGLGAAKAFLEPAGYITLHWVLLFVVEASLVLLDPADSQFRLARMGPDARAHAVGLAVIYGTVAYLAFVVGYLLPPKDLGSRLPYFRINKATAGVRRAVVWLFMAIGLSAFAMFGFKEVVEMLLFSASRTSTAAGSGYTFVLIEGWSIGLIISYAFRRARGRMSLALTAVYVLAVSPMMAFGRTDFLFVVLAYVVIAAYSKAPTKARTLAIAGVSMVVLASFLLVARRYAGGFDQQVLVDQGSAHGIAAARHTFASFDDFVNYMTVRHAVYWKKFGPEYLIGFVLYGLPGKALNPYALTIPQTLMTYVYQADGGAPATILSITDVALGPLGSLVFMGMAGALTRLFSDYVRGRSEMSAVLMLALFDSRIHQVLWGSYVSGMLQMVMAFGWLTFAFILLATRRRGRRPDRARAAAGGRTVHSGVARLREYG